MNETRVNLFETIRFFSNVFNLLDPDVKTLQQSNGLLRAGFPIAIGAF